MIEVRVDFVTSSASARLVLVWSMKAETYTSEWVPENQTSFLRGCKEDVSEWISFLCSWYGMFDGDKREFLVRVSESVFSESSAAPP